MDDYRWKECHKFQLMICTDAQSDKVIGVRNHQGPAIINTPTSQSKSNKLMFDPIFASKVCQLIVCALLQVGPSETKPKEVICLSLNQVSFCCCNISQFVQFITDYYR